ncbi:MAG: RecX family transcriptional regulator [Candidatus Blackburnbacteria bacterium]|nr:RecX family transcriptional regulator [Candidatus Blackburnbacteria bacterium]
MAVIARLTQQKKNNRVNVYLDGKYAFGVTLESALENHLKVGMELSTQKIEELRGKDYQDKIYARLLSFASRRPHSQKEFEQWFRKRKVDPAVHQSLLDKLARIGLLNEEEFARWWVEQRITFRCLPPKMLKMELRGKGIKDDVIERILQEAEAPSEVELARKVLKKRFGKIPQNTRDLKEKKRVYDFLLRRGFSYAVVKEALTDNSAEEYN